jgi:hypothetical protein
LVLSETILDELLDYLDVSIKKLAQQTLASSEFHMDSNMGDFLSSQYDVRLDNMLQRKNSNIHHLESGIKNKIIQRKKKLIDEILKL